MIISILRAVYYKTIRIFKKKEKLTQAATVASIQSLVNWISSEYSVTIHNAEATKSVYVYILNEKNERICKIRLSDHAEAFPGKDLYIISPVNSSNYIAYLEDVRMPMIFNFNEMKSFISHFILIKYSTKVANDTIDASTAIKLKNENNNVGEFIDFPNELNREPINEPINEPIKRSNELNDDVQESYIVKVDNDDVDLTKYTKKSYLMAHWGEYWNTFMWSKFPALATISAGQQDAIKGAFCKKKLNADLQLINFKFAEAYFKNDGKFGPTVSDFIIWINTKADGDQKLYKKGQIDTNIDIFRPADKDNKFNIKINLNSSAITDDIKNKYATFDNRDKLYSSFIDEYLNVIFENIKNTSGGVRNNLHMAYCNKKANLTLSEIDELFIYYIDHTDSIDAASRKLIKTIKTGDGYQTYLDWKKSNESEIVDIPLVVVDKEEIEEKQEINDEYLNQINGYDKMTNKQKIIVNDLFRLHNIDPNEVILHINEANKFGRDIKKMRKAYKKLCDVM